MTMRVAFAWLVAPLVVLSMSACGDPPAGSQHSPAPRLETLTVDAAGPAGGASWDGVVQAVEQSVLSAQTSGRVVALSADVDQQVAGGAVLLRLTAEEQQAAADTAAAQLRAAEAQQADAASRFQRASELVGRQLISRDDFDRVRAAHDSANANRDAVAAVLSQARQQLAYTLVRAPYAGLIAARHVELGETVAPGQPLFTLYAPGELRLEVQLPQAQARAVRNDAAATVMLADGRELAAAKVIVYPAADPQAHSTTVRIMLPVLQDPPRPGHTARVRFAVTDAPAGIWLPTSAVVVRGELAAAYVVGDPDIVLRQLRIGRVQGDRVEIIAGLSVGERVAASPAAAMAALRATRGAAADAHE
jgi:RND family efflux transporter MFP subunit